MDSDCARVAYQLEVIAERTDDLVRRLLAAEGIDWVSLAAGRFRHELSMTAEQVSATAHAARQAANAVRRHGMAVELVRSVVSP